MDMRIYKSRRNILIIRIRIPFYIYDLSFRYRYSARIKFPVFYINLIPFNNFHFIPRFLFVIFILQIYLFTRIYSIVPFALFSMFHVKHFFYLPNKINKTLMSEGDTPVIRDACPIVFGLIFVNF